MTFGKLSFNRTEGVVTMYALKTRILRYHRSLVLRALHQHRKGVGFDTWRTTYS